MWGSLTRRSGPRAVILSGAKDLLSNSIKGMLRFAQPDKLGIEKPMTFLRELCGENDYDRYRTKALRQGGNLLSREAFFLENLEHKYARPNCCC
jgi:putative selenoprotein